VFRYGNFSFAKKILSTIVSILDLGFKFVPYIFNDDLSFFNYLLHKIDSHTLEINKYLFFNKMNEMNINNSNSNKEKINSRVNFDENNISQTNSRERIDDFIDTINSNYSVKKKSNLESYPLLQESLFLRSKIYEELSSVKFNYINNLNLLKFKLYK